MAFQQGDLEATLTLRDFMTRELKKSESSVKQFATRSRASLNRLGKAFITLGGAVSVFGASKFLKSSIDAFGRQEKAIAGMEQVMKSMGRFTPELSEKMQQLARDIQAVGISGDETVLEGQKFLITYGKITDELLPAATRTMADLAALTGKDMVAAANLLGKASEGMTGELKRYGISLSEASLESKDFELILKDIQKQVKGQQRALRQTGFGGIEAFKNAWGDLKEEVGEAASKVIAPAIQDLTKDIQGMGDASEKLEPIFREAFETALLFGARVADGYLVAKQAAIEFGIAAVKSRIFAEEVVSFDWWDDFRIGLGSLILSEEDLQKEIMATAKAQKFKATGVKGLTDAEVALVELESLKRREYERSFSVYEDTVIWLEKINAARAKDAKPAAVAGPQQEALKSNQKISVSLRDQLGLLDTMGLRWTEIDNSIDPVLPKTKAINKATNEYVGTMDDLQQFWGQVFESIEDSKKATDDFSDRVRTFAAEWDLWYGKNTEKTREVLSIQEGLRSAFEGAASVIESSFIRALDESLDKGVQWRQLAQDILGDFSKMAISMAFKFGVSAASSAIFGAEKGGMFDGLGDRVPVRTYARGGVMGAQAEMAVMNEGRRREAVVPLPDNRSIPVKILDGGGRGDVHIHLDGVLDGQNAMAVLERHADGIMSIVNRKQQENPQRF